MVLLHSHPGGGARRKIRRLSLAARCMGMPLREATALGILMNTRGLMETGHPQHRSGRRNHLSSAVFHDGDHGPFRYADDDSAARLALFKEAELASRTSSRLPVRPTTQRLELRCRRELHRRLGASAGIFGHDA